VQPRNETWEALTREWTCAGRQAADFLEFQLLRARTASAHTLCAETYNKAILALMIYGRKESALALARLAYFNFLSDNEGAKCLRCGLEAHRRCFVYSRAWLAWGLAAVGQDRHALSILGDVSSFSGPHGGIRWSVDRSESELRGTALASIVALECGEETLARQAGRFVTWLAKYQHHNPAVLYLRANSHGPVAESAPFEVDGHATRYVAGGTNELDYAPALGVIACLLLYRRFGEAELMDAALQYWRYLVPNLESVVGSRYGGKAGGALALLARTAGVQGLSQPLLTSLDACMARARAHPDLDEDAWPCALTPCFGRSLDTVSEAAIWLAFVANEFAPDDPAGPMAFHRARFV
jgi:hypothetical protein